MRLAVIGTAGRGTDVARIDRALYDLMFEEVVAFARSISATRVVSGGAAVADHLAVRAYLEGVVPYLTLYLPTGFETGRFAGHNAATRDVAATTNRYHEAFSVSCGVDGLAELREVMSTADIFVHEGFKRRNLEVAADCDAMIALTFGRGPSSDYAPDSEGFSDSTIAGLKDGGTAHTWSECWRPKIKRHVNLNALLAVDPNDR